MGQDGTFGGGELQHAAIALGLILPQQNSHIEGFLVGGLAYFNFID
jgi:hypothetical protein